jgi:hypothetical protein
MMRGKVMFLVIYAWKGLGRFGVGLASTLPLQNEEGSRRCLDRLRVILLLSLVVSCAGCSEDSRFLFQTLFPPEGLYDSLVELPVVLDGGAESYEFSWRCRFHGTHSIDIAVTRPPRTVTHSFDSDLEINLLISVGGSLALSLPGRLDMPFSTSGDYPGGFSLLFFDVPEDLPAGETIRCVLLIDRGDPTFQEKYGDAMLVVRKFPDM